MRFVFAILAFIVSALLIGLGIAQRTVFASPDHVTLTAASEQAPVTVIDGQALTAFAGSQTLNISGSDQVVAAYGRTTDVLAWVGEARHTIVTFDEESGELVADLVNGSETEVPNPEGSDLWFEDYEEEGSLALTVTVPEDISFVIASDGVEPAPSDISITWPVDTSTPLVGPMILGGAAFALLGIALLIWATLHMRSAHGPKRSTPAVPGAKKRRFGRRPTFPAADQASIPTWRNPDAASADSEPTAPESPEVDATEPQTERPEKTETSESTSVSQPAEQDGDQPRTERTFMVAKRRGILAVPLLVTALALTGCSADVWPDGAADATPTPTATLPEGAELTPPATTVRQVERIVAQVSALAAEADETRDATILEPRFEGPALELRTANYAIRNADANIAPLTAIPDGPVKVTLPQQTDTWPRTVFAVIQDDQDATIPPIALYLVQEDPRSNYKVNYAITLEPSAVLPDVAPANIGAARLPADSGLLAMTPEDAALAYADILMKDVESESYLLFEADGDTLRTNVGLDAKNQISASLPATAAASFSNGLGEADPIAMATNDAGAIVAVTLTETTTVTPVEAGAAINPSGQVKALSGIAVSTKGVVATYSDQLLFAIPPAGSDAKIVLLGYSQGLVSATEVG
ncbi:hypothetical protein M2152_001574 [Microbacteriaceae bacterium SG_E_30_P1]|uniref:DUF8094 domain-containing protein n=1 Tax=Antiquaquibacter oligotrophicus TaxID=2880260 RepID=A0ABT6KQL2_9MICO|nr:hypothetical protein [Antiquaquibacter oligotrophicus]MDH6181392.1 hypothetical protein [Antiquaquibacter oligotrophicus]UDF12916.1 hypothetical protein LH407_12245 [Antiquaquibacter oligotrophicus]